MDEARRRTLKSYATGSPGFASVGRGARAGPQRLARRARTPHPSEEGTRKAGCLKGNTAVRHVVLTHDRRSAMRSVLQGLVLDETC